MLNLNFAFSLILITLTILLASWFFNFKSAGWKRGRWPLLVMVIGGAVYLRMNVQIESISINSSLLSFIFLLSAGLIALLITLAVNQEMNFLARILFGILIGLTLTAYIFQAFDLLKRLNLPILPIPAEFVPWIQALIWLAATFLFAAAFNSKMKPVLRILLGVVCSLALIAFLRDSLLMMTRG